MNFGLTVTFKEGHAQVDVTNSHPVHFSAAWGQSVTAYAVVGALIFGSGVYLSQPKKSSPGRDARSVLSWKLLLTLFTFSSLSEHSCHWRWFVCISVSCVHSQASLASLGSLLSSTVPTQGVFCPVCWTSRYFHKAPCTVLEKHTERCKGIS